MADYEKLRKMCDNIGIAKGKQSDEYLFTLHAVDLFYFKKNIGEVDIKTGFIDGKGDGGIDYIYSDGETMYLIQGKSTDNLNQEEIENLFTKITKTISRFEERNTDEFSPALKSVYQNAYDNLSDDKNIELVLFTNTELNDERRKKIISFANSEAMLSYKISVYDKLDIQTQDAIVNTDSDLVEYDKIRILLSDDGNSILSYGEDGIIVNVMASSLKKLFEKYEKKGLFSYNLREYISQKSVDDGIESTIKQDREHFWFYNNGITIGCREFIKDGNTIKLYGFSIINGAQTTTKIGKSKIVNEKNDFAVVCKIVRAEKSEQLDRDFIGKISEASNSQKPIKPRDLKANAKEQKILQNESANNGKYSLAIEIKRGVKPVNYKKVDKWQRVSNEYVGQLIYACVFQHPGPARNSKNLMFSSSKQYNQIFLRKHDYDTLYDLVRIGAVYDEFAAETITKTDDVDQIALIRNGKFTVLGIVIYLYKKQKKLVDNYLSEQVNKDNIRGLLVTDYAGDDLDSKLKNIFSFVVRQLKIIYESNKASLKTTSYSNFFKSDTNYEVIQKSFDELDSYDLEKLASFMTVFEDKQK